MPARYKQLLTLIDELKPLLIVEVGTHRGTRARMMCERALHHQLTVRYIGFDVFDTESAEFQAAAWNHKGVASKQHAERALRSMLGLTYDLVVGRTEDTLTEIAADLAFIDGDHRADAIRQDWLKLSNSRCVVFDDYYDPEIEGLGCNQVVREIGAELLPISDQTDRKIFMAVWRNK